MIGELNSKFVIKSTSLCISLLSVLWECVVSIVGVYWFVSIVGVCWYVCWF